MPLPSFNFDNVISVTSSDEDEIEVVSETIVPVTHTELTLTPQEERDLRGQMGISRDTKASFRIRGANGGKISRNKILDASQFSTSVRVVGGAFEKEKMERVNLRKILKPANSSHSVDLSNILSVTSDDEEGVGEPPAADDDPAVPTTSRGKVSKRRRKSTRQVTALLADQHLSLIHI